ncbi:MAG: SLC13 family permease [archaeon]|nr:SLC13 family permease [archaeon]
MSDVHGESFIANFGDSESEDVEDVEDRTGEGPLKRSGSSASLLVMPEPVMKKKASYEAKKLSWGNVQKREWWKSLCWRNKGSAVYLVAVAIALMILGLTVDMWGELEWEAWYSVSVTLLTFLLLVRNDWDPALTMMLSTTLLLAPNIITPRQALEGFSNPGVFTIAILFITAKAVSDSGVLTVLVRRLIPQTSNLMLAMAMLLVPASLLSGFVANTPLVAMMIPLFESFSRQRGFPLSKLLIPLSYACILGGTLTMIGTSTNLIVSGLATQRDPTLEFPFFDIAIIGGPITVVGLLYVVLVGQLDWMLPIRTPAYSALLAHPRAYLISLRVPAGSEVASKTVDEARLRHLKGVFLVEVQRAEETVPAPGPEFVLRENDTLLFSGDVENVGDLLNMPGLVPTHEEESILQNYRRILVEVIISGTSSLVGVPIKDSSFREKFDAAIVSVHRSGHEIKGKIGEIELNTADGLLIVCKPHFLRYEAHSPDFLNVQRIGQSPVSYPRFQMVMAPLLQIAMVAIA